MSLDWHALMVRKASRTVIAIFVGLGLGAAVYGCSERKLAIAGTALAANRTWRGELAGYCWRQSDDAIDVCYWLNGASDLLFFSRNRDALFDCGAIVADVSRASGLTIASSDSAGALRQSAMLTDSLLRIRTPPEDSSQTRPSADAYDVRRGDATLRPTRATFGQSMIVRALRTTNINVVSDATTPVRYARRHRRSCSSTGSDGVVHAGARLPTPNRPP